MGKEAYQIEFTVLSEKIAELNALRESVEIDNLGLTCTQNIGNTNDQIEKLISQIITAKDHLLLLIEMSAQYLDNININNRSSDNSTAASVRGNTN